MFLPSLLIRDLGNLFKQESALDESPLLLRDGQVEGRFGDLYLSTVFKRIRSAAQPGVVNGYQAGLRLYAERESPHFALDDFANAQHTSALINLDRLCRTIHLLNFLGLPDNDARLFLPVNPNYVIAVKKNHGAYFEDVLARCERSPEQVVVSVSLGLWDGRAAAAVARGLENYRARGYRIALQSERKPHPENSELALLREINPDYFITPHGFGAAPDRFDTTEALSRLRSTISVARGLGAEVVVEGVASARQADLSLAAGANWVQGEYYEAGQQRTGSARPAEPANDGGDIDLGALLAVGFA